MGRGRLCSIGPSVGCCHASKRAPSSVASNAAAFSAAGVLGDVNRVCWCPMLTPMAEVTVSSSSSCSSGVASSSEGVRSESSTTDANRMSARALCLSLCALGVMGAGSAIAEGRERVCVRGQVGSRCPKARPGLSVKLAVAVSYLFPRKPAECQTGHVSAHRPSDTAGKWTSGRSVGAPW
jgi:hypothetical protein